MLKNVFIILEDVLKTNKTRLKVLLLSASFINMPLSIYERKAMRTPAATALPITPEMLDDMQ